MQASALRVLCLLIVMNPPMDSAPASLSASLTLALSGVPSQVVGTGLRGERFMSHGIFPASRNHSLGSVLRHSVIMLVVGPLAFQGPWQGP